MAIQSEAEVFEDGQALFPESGDVAANAGVATSAVERAKATGDLHPDLHRAEGPFGFVVGERQVQLPEEGEDAVMPDEGRHDGLILAEAALVNAVLLVTDDREMRGIERPISAGAEKMMASFMVCRSA